MRDIQAIARDQQLIGLAGLLLLLVACDQPAQAKMCALDLSGRVVDQAGILSAANEAALTRKLEALSRLTSDQLVVATTTSLNNYEIEEYSINLARCWQVGAQKQSNGIMLLVAPSERKARIEVGKGLEDFVKDEEAKVIMTQAMLPNFNGGNYDEGVDAGVNALIAELTADSAAAAARYSATHLQGQKR